MHNKTAIFGSILSLVVFSTSQSAERVAGADDSYPPMRIAKVASHLADEPITAAEKVLADANNDGIIDAGDLVATEVTTRIMSGTATVEDSQFTVEVAIERNTGSYEPLAASLRLYFPSESVTFLGATAGDLGSIFMSNSDENTTAPGFPDRFRDITTGSNFSNTDPTPVIFRANFRVNSDAEFPYDIVVANDPGTASNIIDKMTRKIPHYFDNRFTIGIEPTISPLKK